MAVLLLFSVSERAQTQSTINLNRLGPADWNNPGSWDQNFVPGDDFSGEVAGISNSGTALLDSSAMFPVDGVILGESGFAAENGTLDIRGAGSLTVTPGGGTAQGAVLVGNSGRGRLIIGENGSLTAESLQVLGATGDDGSELQLQDRAALRVGGDVNIARNTRLTGPNLTFNVGGNLAVDGRFIYEITDSADSTIQVPSGLAKVNGTLVVDTSGYSPTLGDTWTLIDAAELQGTFSTVDVSAAPIVDPGLGYIVSYNLQEGTVDLSVDSRLMLNINRQTGEASIRNLIGTVDMDGYVIRSASGALNPNAWSSLDKQMVDADRWMEANPSVKHLAELNLEGMTSLGAGNALSMGNPFELPSPMAFGEHAPEDLTFEYTTPSGALITGLVAYEGQPRHNNLVLTVDPTSGDSVIRNPSPFSVAIDAYVISSESGSLDPGGWNSFDDQMLGNGQWAEANPTTDHLSELNLLDTMTLNNGDEFLIGTPFVAADGSRDLTFEFLLAGGNEAMRGIVEYAQLAAPSLLQAGDANQDLSFDQLDVVAVLVAGKYLSGQPATWGEGDWNGAPGGSADNPPLGDGLFNQLDIVAALTNGLYLTGPYDALRPNVKANEGQTSIAYRGGGGDPGYVDYVPVPEPSCFTVVMFGLLGLLAHARQLNL